MKVELFPFQKQALTNLRLNTAEALGSYRRTHTPQIVSYTAPTGAGKTIVMSSLIESILFGDDTYPDQLDAIFVWLSDSPELNQQSKDKIDLKADKITLDQCKIITDDSFDQEMLDDGNIYFLNTQKLGKSSNLTKHGDGRTYTIWETLANTVREKSDRLYFIIDEAHRGMQARDAAKATTIMQKFLKGSPDDGLPVMPVVIGMTATPERFNNLASGIMSTTHFVVTTADEVRASGLLKDRIIITYPDTINNDMAVLQAAADDWKQKWEHWTQYCYEQHYAYVNPVFVIQVQNGSGNQLSATDLDDCLQKIEERTGERFQPGEVVHTFGQTNGTLVINGIEVNYCEPSRIADDRKIKVVFFKENLSTGWDCPRAETMMSFRHANDATYIAQLLGRMVRTPMQMHIMVDDVLNDVHLFLPYFNAETVKDVAEALQSTEGGNIPTDVYGEAFGEKTFDTLTVRPKQTTPRAAAPRHEVITPGQLSLDDIAQPESDNMGETAPSDAIGATASSAYAQTPSGQNVQTVQEYPAPIEETPNDSDVSSTAEEITADFDREEVMKAINDAGLLTYEVRSVRINNYLHSLFALSHLFSQSLIYQNAYDEVCDDIVRMVHDYIESLKSSGKYSELATKVLQFKLNTQVFDVFGESVDNNAVHDFLSATDTDLDRQFRLADTKLGNEGIGVKYGREYQTEDNPNGFKIDIIIYAADSNCIAALNTFAKDRFHVMNDRYRRQTINLPVKYKKKYNDIVSDGDLVSAHIFMLPETINCEHSANGRVYSNHLFVDNSGVARIALNNWEQGVLDEEAARSDFVCWLRNPPRKPWSLSIPYEKDGVYKPAYPDFLVIRKDAHGGYIIDILEPHDQTRTDNLGKAKGFAEYARNNPVVGRIQLIRMASDGKFKRLDMSKTAVRDKVKQAINDDELTHIFDTDGFCM
jgi:type III restriction enzyme